MYNVEEVFKNCPSQDIQDRMNIIADTIDGLILVQTELQSSGHWCSKCSRWYYKTDCQLKFEKKTKTICTNPLMGYLEPYEYEEETYLEYFEACPEGHEISKTRKWGGTLR